MVTSLSVGAWGMLLSLIYLPALMIDHFFFHATILCCEECVTSDLALTN